MFHLLLYTMALIGLAVSTAAVLLAGLVLAVVIAGCGKHHAAQLEELPATPKNWQ